jgi:hypothetical protein
MRTSGLRTHPGITAQLIKSVTEVSEVSSLHWCPDKTTPVVSYANSLSHYNMNLLKFASRTYIGDAS